MKPENKSISFQNRLFQIFVSLLLFIAIFTALLPTLLSTGLGQKAALSVVNRFIPGSISAKEMEFSWFGQQKLSGVKLKDIDDNTILRIQTLTTNASLFDLLSRRLDAGTANITGLEAAIVEERPGLTNIQRALGSTSWLSQTNDEPFKPFTIILKDVDATFHLRSVSEPIVINLKGKTQQDDVSGHFAVEMTCTNPLSCNWTEMAENGDLALNVNVVNFPVALLDHVISMQNPGLTGIAKAAFGNTLNLSVKESSESDQMSFEVKASAPTFTADLLGGIRHNKFFLTKPGKALFTITPAFIEFLTHLNHNSLPLRLLKPTQAQLTINQLSFPLESPEQGYPDVSIVGVLDLEEADLSSDSFMGTLTLQKLKAFVQAPEKALTANLKIDSEANYGDQTSHITVNALINKPIRLDSFYDHIFRHAKIQTEMENLPLAVLDGLMRWKNTLVNNVGNSSTVKMNAVIEEENADISLSFTGEKLSAPSVHLISDINGCQITAQLLTSKHPLLSALLGESTQLQYKVAQNDLQANISSNNVTARVLGKIDGTQFLLNAPATFQYILTPAFMQAMGLDEHAILHLKQATPIELTINPMQKPIDLENLTMVQFSNIIMSGQLVIKELALSREKANGRQGETVLIRDMSMPWELDPAHNKLKLNVKSNTLLTGNVNGSLNGEIRILNWLQNNAIDPSEADIEASLQIEKVPVLLFGAFSEKEEIVKLFGPTLDIDLYADLRNGTESMHAIDLTLRGNQLKGTMLLEIDEGITLKDDKPIDISMTLTPERFSALRQLLQSSEDPIKVDSLVLARPAELNAVITRFDLPSVNGEVAPIVNASLKAAITLDSLHVVDQKRNQQMALEKITAQLDSPDISKKIDFHIGAQETNTPNALNDIVFSGTLENALTPNGELNFQGASLQLEAKSNRLPAALFCQLACSDDNLGNKVEALFGHTIATDVRVQLKHMDGPLQATLEGKNGRVNMDAQLTNGVLTLNKPLKIEVAVTPQLAKSVLQDIIPILSGVQSADQPIKITVQPQNFALPLRQFDIKKIQVGQAVIELGKMQFSNTGELVNVFSLLKPAVNEKLTAWFTPLYLKMDGGTLKLERMDMLLLNRYPIAIWGKVNFPKDKVDMLIGLTGMALYQALDLADLEEDFMMQLPFRGKIGDAAIDKGAATTRIGALVAQNAGSPPGVLIGTFLDLAGGSLADRKAPEPTTNPLPWETSAPQKKNKDKVDKPSNLKKQLEAGANALINNLLR